MVWLAVYGHRTRVRKHLGPDLDPLLAELFLEFAIYRPLDELLHAYVLYQHMRILRQSLRNNHYLLFYHCKLPNPGPGIDANIEPAQEFLGSSVHRASHSTRSGHWSWPVRRSLS